MPDEAIYAVRALGFWQHGSLPLFGSSGAGYSALYPVFAGGPLSIGSQATGYARPQGGTGARHVARGVARLRRTRAGSCRTATRCSPRALTLACPLVLFSGFVMTEVLYYPLAAAALLATARAVSTASLKDQAIALVLIAAAVATRVQGVVLLAIFVLAIVVDAALGRRWPDVAPVLADLVARRGRRDRGRGSSRRVRRVLGGGQRELQRRACRAADLRPPRLPDPHGRRRPRRCTRPLARRGCAPARTRMRARARSSRSRRALSSW